VGAGVCLDDEDEEAIRGLLAQSRQKLFSIRNKRPRPHLDDKIIAAWNGLMISAFARAAPGIKRRLLSGSSDAGSELYSRQSLR
jgi:uncharacterized protein YyaL (SSP411 family)